MKDTHLHSDVRLRKCSRLVRGSRCRSAGLNMNGELQQHKFPTEFLWHWVMLTRTGEPQWTSSTMSRGSHFSLFSVCFSLTDFNLQSSSCARGYSDVPSRDHSVLWDGWGWFPDLVWYHSDAHVRRRNGSLISGPAYYFLLKLPPSQCFNNVQQSYSLYPISWLKK